MKTINQENFVFLRLPIFVTLALFLNIGTAQCDKSIAVKAATPPQPTKVIQVGKRIHHELSPYFGEARLAEIGGNAAWGFAMSTTLRLVDQKNRAYTKGAMREDLDIVYAFGPRVPSTGQIADYRGKFGSYTTNVNELGEFEDTNGLAFPEEFQIGNDLNEPWVTLDQDFSMAQRITTNGQGYIPIDERLPDEYVGKQLNTHRLGYHRGYYTRTPGY